MADLHLSQTWRVAVIGLVLVPLAATAGEPKLVSVEKIWDKAPHNAFTDLVRFRDRFYCVFREAEGHIGGDGEIRVLVSDDGEKWTSAALLKEKGIDLRDPKLSVTADDRPGSSRPPERDDAPLPPDGEMIALVRREGANRNRWIGTSPPPYNKWTWHEPKHRLGGPNFIRFPNGELWAASRSYLGGAKTVLAHMSHTSYDPALTLPSGGDTSYPRLVWHDDLLWMSYHSSHEGKSSIYLAKIRFE